MDVVDRTTYRIRPAAPQDVGELIRMQMALQRSLARVGTNMLHLRHGSTDRLHAYYRAQIDDGLSRLFVAQHRFSERAVGMGAGHIWLHADYVPDRSGELIDLWVDPEHRRKGLARRLVTRLLKFFRASGIEFIAVNYVQGNPLADILWQKFGFQPALVTATAERREVETAVGLRSQRIVPMEIRPIPDNGRVCAGVSLSG